jgi:hypothetical protein
MLRGAAGAIMGLPLLDAMSSIASAAATGGARKLPVRMAVLYMANGVNVDQWALRAPEKASNFRQPSSPSPNTRMTCSS